MSGAARVRLALRSTLALALVVSSTGCVTRTVWDWARDRPDRGACSVAYLDDTGRRVAISWLTGRPDHIEMPKSKVK